MANIIAAINTNGIVINTISGTIIVKMDMKNETSAAATIDTISLIQYAFLDNIVRITPFLIPLVYTILHPINNTSPLRISPAFTKQKRGEHPSFLDSYTNVIVMVS